MYNMSDVIPDDPFCEASERDEMSTKHCYNNILQDSSARYEHICRQSCTVEKWGLAFQDSRMQTQNTMTDWNEPGEAYQRSAGVADSLG